MYRTILATLMKRPHGSSYVSLKKRVLTALCLLCSEYKHGIKIVQNMEIIGITLRTPFIAFSSGK